MNDPTDTRFFNALQEVLSESAFANCAECRAAVDKAIQTSAPLDLREARLHIDALPGTLRDEILARVHARMASDLSAIWDFMSNAQGSQKPN